MLIHHMGFRKVKVQGMRFEGIDILGEFPVKAVLASVLIVGNDMKQRKVIRKFYRIIGYSKRLDKTHQQSILLRLLPQHSSNMKINGKLKSLKMNQRSLL